MTGSGLLYFFAIEFAKKKKKKKQHENCKIQSNFLWLWILTMRRQIDTVIYVCTRNTKAGPSALSLETGG